ncbi:MAG: efflux RND transporter periplasmic adaptor subunit [Deltaproteobacteria bacterium]|nr:efflux RND transporter periplasmic adaptor subunit [Deltaproteobacteria bacterium]
MRRLRYISIVVVLAGLLGLGFFYFRGGAKEAAFVTAPVQRGDITQVVTATGSLSAVVTVQVGSQVSGTIAKLHADFNSKVKQRQVVAELDQDKFKAAVAQAKANLAAAQANVAKAKVSVEDTRRTLERNRELRKRDLIAQSELDAAQTAYDAALAQVEVNRAQVEQARAALEQATVDLAHTVIRSPVDGTVVSRNVDVGQTVAASLQAPVLFLIANDMSKMQVDTNVNEADIANVWVRQEVNFTVDAHPTRRFKGEVLQVRNAPIMVQNVVTYDAVVGVDNKDLLLKPGMTANVEFLVSRKSDVLKIPNAALRFRLPADKQQDQAVARRASGGRREGRREMGERSKAREDGQRRVATIYVSKDQQAVPVKVRLGITDGSNTEILEGEIQERHQVILALAEGTKVNSQGRVSNPFRTRGFGWFR